MCCHAQEKVVGANFQVLSLEVAIEKRIITLNIIRYHKKTIARE